MINEKYEIDSTSGGTGTHKQLLRSSDHYPYREGANFDR